MEEENDLEKKYKTFDVSIDEGAKLSVETSPINESLSEEGQPRQDKKVEVTSIDGSTTMSTSNILLGYNLDSLGNPIIQLTDGTYVNVSDIANAIEEAYETVEEGKKIVTASTGKTASLEEIKSVIKIALEAGKITLSKNQNIKNQSNAKSITITGKDDEVEKSFGSMFLGNDPKFNLPNGDYVSTDEVQKALQQYLIQEEVKEVSKTEELLEPKKQESKRRKILTSVIRLVDIAAIPIVMFKAGAQDKKTDVTDITATIAYTDVVEAPKDIIDSNSDIEIGDILNLDEGIVVHESSDYKYGGKNNTATVGGTSLPKGNYPVNYISVINPNDKQIIRVYSEEGKSLADAITECSDKTGVSPDELEGYIHFEGLDKKGAGWIRDVDISVLGDKNPTPEVIMNYVVKSEEVSETRVGDEATSTIVNGAAVPLTDEKGILLKAGQVIKGSDGNAYSIESIKTKENNQNNGSEITETSFEFEYVNPIDEISKIISEIKERISNNSREVVNSEGVNVL